MNGENNHATLQFFFDTTHMVFSVKLFVNPDCVHLGLCENSVSNLRTYNFLFGGYLSLFVLTREKIH